MNTLRAQEIPKKNFHLRKIHDEYFVKVCLRDSPALFYFYYFTKMVSALKLYYMKNSLTGFFFI